jgi:hypothetical protein
MLPVKKLMINFGIQLTAGDIIDITVDSVFNVGIIPPLPALQSYVRGKSITIEKKLLTI